ncbi:high frequency lysogenization protein HflD [Shewanella sp. JNE10-2]|uniref:High frequency lysogenization protein HflD homolog n=1 Tax=Shewanella putrefaciens (strain 200) TaxID=399804 RepID=E6XNB4_SHEP2|nr:MULTISPECIES: high frequency lysogenization protein HflD [unclassified Shewanella]MCK7629454.1 high frequency lysogenization protein HflD [Shewanella sp. JNE9-1]MCK7644624.1 high frequency lysogenization protein HflD [Shewanella sp. JNE3-1]MCK7652757.1 high frequency lysogenization protein HflD [Shewanella sp. JNE4-1]UPO26529.1 high frequency lysogenization protein HflD [Shewanella sp. JNE10-2]UPO33726.1 high frequency lysogenization protein HflD [Shewanella sp. JNE7]
MNEQLINRTMAFAGILQAIAQVQHLARHGELDNAELAASLNTILVTNPDNTDDVYPDKIVLQKGYKLILNQLGDSSQKDVEITRYLVGVLALERKLVRSNSGLGMLAERINQVNRQLHHFAITDEQVVANLASIYSDIISNLGPKIQISGNPVCLQRPIVQHKIRALLLAAIRSAVLWRQLGGKRRHLVFARKAIVDTAKKSLTL